MELSKIMPRETAIVKGTHYRITVLTSRLIRMEYSEKNEFVDAQTQTVTNRRFPVPEFSINDTEGALEIITEYLHLVYDKKDFSPEGLSVSFDGGLAKWSYGDISRDLKGTARTLDEANGEIPLESGIISADGWSVLDDSRTLLVNEDGWIGQRADKGSKDIYFFGYGKDYLACLKDFHFLTGNVPLLPRFALGNWWSRYYKYTEKTYLDLMNRFEKEQIPFTVSVIDMDWHLTEIDQKYGSGWTGYTWNREMFPDPERFMKDLHRRGLKVTLNVHPADGVRAFEDCYPDFAEYMGVDKEKEEPVVFDVGSPKFMKGYFKYIHHPMEKQGVDFWWIDWQQGTNSKIEGLDPLWMLNHFHYLDSCKNNKRGLIFSRYSGPGSHRYPVGFSGDTVITWESLDFQPYFTATASNIGYGWWSHDIGGHMHGIKNDELATRWVQLGVFSPIMRLHSSCNEFNGKEPWRYNLVAETVMKKFLRLRHKMIPYLYTMNLRASESSMALIQPIYYQNPMRLEAYQVKNEYYFGSELIVCPITKPADRETGMAEFSAWLPEGIWTDLFTGVVYEGDRWIKLHRGVDSIPVLIKSGGILVLDGQNEGNKTDNPAALEICVNATGDGEFVLMEDDGLKVEFSEDHWCRTSLKMEGGNFTIYPALGNTDVLPEKRSYLIRFYGLDENVIPTVSVNGVNVSDADTCYDSEKGILEVSIPEISVKERTEVKLDNVGIHDNQKLTRVFEYLNKAEIAFEHKERIYHVVKGIARGERIAHVIKRLQMMPWRLEIIGPITEILTAK